MTDTIFLPTPITETDSLPEGNYIVTNGLGWFQVQYDNQFGFYQEFTDCSGLTSYLRPVSRKDYNAEIARKAMEYYVDNRLSKAGLMLHEFTEYFLKTL